MAEYKIILLGDPGVGKTTFFLRLRDGEFVDTENRPTASIGVDDMEYQHVVEGTGIKVCRRCLPLQAVCICGSAT